jgi:hypothetical protein
MGEEGRVGPGCIILVVIATAAGVATARAIGVTVGTGFAAIVVPFFFNGIARVYYAQAGFTSTFHLGNGGHSQLLDIKTLNIKYMRYLNSCSWVKHNI